jgi:hypothetical protein
MFFICQQQPHTDQVEVIYSTPNEEVAINECERTNANLAAAGIPSDYYFFVL